MSKESPVPTPNHEDSPHNPYAGYLTSPLLGWSPSSFTKLDNEDEATTRQLLRDMYPGLPSEAFAWIPIGENQIALAYVYEINTGNKKEIWREPLFEEESLEKAVAQAVAALWRLVHKYAHKKMLVYTLGNRHTLAEVLFFYANRFLLSTAEDTVSFYRRLDQLRQTRDARYDRYIEEHDVASELMSAYELLTLPTD